MEKLIQIGDIFEMIWNHSQFLEIMLATTEVNQSKDDMKGVHACVLHPNAEGCRCMSAKSQAAVV